MRVDYRVIFALLLALVGIERLMALNMAPYDNALWCVCFMAASSLVWLWAGVDSNSALLRSVSRYVCVVFSTITILLALLLPEAHRDQERRQKAAEETYRQVGEYIGKTGDAPKPQEP